MLSINLHYFLSSGSAASSLKDAEVCGTSLNAETDLQLIMHSEKFQYSLLVMERSIMGNTFQPKLAAYRQLPVLEGKVSSPAKCTSDDVMKSIC